jgi:putative membrane protein
MRMTIAVGGLLSSLALVLGAGPPAAQSAIPVVSLGASSSASQPGGGGQLSDQDQTFMRQNAQTDLAEITSGPLAAQRGTTEAIRQTGQTLASDHQQALSELQGIAKTYSAVLPTTPNATQQQEAEQLKSLTGTAFDQAYTTDEIKGHQLSIQQTQQETSSGSNAQVKQFAANYLPTAQKHLQMLQSLSNQASGSNQASPSNPAPGSTQSGNNPSPQGVNAGSGGQAAPWASTSLIVGLLGGGALVVILSALVLLGSRRRA